MLEQFGLAPILPDAGPAFTPWALMARKLRQLQHRSVALVPATHSVGIPTAAVQLAVALQHVTGESVTLLDANTVAPAWPAPADATAASFAEGFWRQELRAGIALCSTVERTQRLDGERLQAQLRLGRDAGGYVLCDCTGLEKMGELDLVLHGVDGALSVARAGKTWEWRLSKLHEHFPKAKDLGVLLVRHRPK